MNRRRASCMISSLGPEKSRTKLFKKGYLPDGKRFWLIFTRNIECEKPQGTICKGPKDTMKITVEVIGSFLQHLRCCWKHKKLEKRYSFQWKKIHFSLFFLVLSNMTNVREQLIRPHKVFWQVLCKLYYHFLGTEEIDNQFFERKSIFPVKRRFRPIFSRIVECDKSQGAQFVRVQNGFWQLFWKF